MTATISKKFDVDEWLRSINIWDEKYDYVMHDSHWLTSKWSPHCEKCQALGSPIADLPKIPEMTPIAPKHISTKSFVTPQTSKKLNFNSNDTFTRNTRQSTKKLLNQSNNQDLIVLNETFYRSALETTPDSDGAPVGTLLDLASIKKTKPPSNGISNGFSNNFAQSDTITKKKAVTNYDLLTNNDNGHFNLAALSKEIDQIEQSQPAGSRIPRIPVRTSR